MARVTVEDCLDRIPNRFALVMLAVRRTRQLLDGAKQMVVSPNKMPVTSLREIASGQVRFKQPDTEEADLYLNR